MDVCDYKALEREGEGERERGRGKGSETEGLRERLTQVEILLSQT